MAKIATSGGHSITCYVSYLETIKLTHKTKPKMLLHQLNFPRSTHSKREFLFQNYTIKCKWLRFLLLNIIVITDFLSFCAHTDSLQAWHRWPISIFFKLNNIFLQNMFINMGKLKSLQGVILTSPGHDLGIYGLEVKDHILTYCVHGRDRSTRYMVRTQSEFTE